MGIRAKIRINRTSQNQPTRTTTTIFNLSNRKKTKYEKMHVIWNKFFHKRFNMMFITFSEEIKMF